MKKSDREHIEEFRSHIDSEHKIEEANTGWGNGVARINIGQLEWCEKIIDILGNGGEKTFSDTVPRLPRETHPAFVRGILDGDGSINGNETTKRLYISGHIPRLKKILDIIPADATVEHTKNHSTDNHGRIRFYGEEASKFADWVYPYGKNTEPKLDRKYPEWKD